MLNRIYIVVAVLLIPSAIISKTLARSGCGGMASHGNDTAPSSHPEGHEGMEHTAVANADPNKDAEPNIAAMRYCKMIMNSLIYLDSPAVVLGQSDVLNLSDEQKESLKRIENETRQKAMEVLTSQQREKLGQIPAEPIMLAQLCRQTCRAKDSDTTMAGCATMNMKKQADKPLVEQTICPVMGGAINKDLFVEYQGKKVYFCCGQCKGEFEKDPEKYIAKLPQFKN